MYSAVIYLLAPTWLRLARRALLLQLASSWGDQTTRQSARLHTMLCLLFLGQGSLAGCSLLYLQRPPLGCNSQELARLIHNEGIECSRVWRNGLVERRNWVLKPSDSL